MLVAFLLALTAGLGSSFTSEPDRIDEWEPFSLRYLCEHAEFLGIVTVLEDPSGSQDDFFQTVKLRVDESWLGELLSEDVSVEYSRYFYGTGYTYTPKAGESCILAIGRSDRHDSENYYAIRYRSAEFEQEYRQAVGKWREINKLDDEARRLAEFAWLVEMLTVKPLREEATLELLPGEPISVDGLWDRTRYRNLLATIPKEVWAEVSPFLSAKDSYVGGRCWHLWYLSHPESALAWLRKQAARGMIGFVARKYCFHSPASGFWNEVCNALPALEVKRLRSATYELEVASRMTRRDRSPVDLNEVQVTLVELQRAVAALEIPRHREFVEPEPVSNEPPGSAYDKAEFVRGNGRMGGTLMTACRSSGFFGFVTVLEKRAETGRFNAELTLEVEETLIGDPRGEQIRAQLLDKLPQGLRPDIEVGDRCLVSIDWNEAENYFEWIIPFLPLEQEDTYRVAAKAWKLLPAEDDPNRLQAELAWLTRFLQDPRVYIDVLPELLLEVYLVENPNKGVGKYRPYFAEIPAEVFHAMGEHLACTDGHWAGLAWKVWLYRDGPAALAWLQRQVPRIEEGWQFDPRQGPSSPALRFWRESAKILPDAEKEDIRRAAYRLQRALNPGDGQIPDSAAVRECVARMQEIVDALTPPPGFDVLPPVEAGDGNQQTQAKGKR